MFYLFLPLPLLLLLLPSDLEGLLNDPDEVDERGQRESCPEQVAAVEPQPREDERTLKRGAQGRERNRGRGETN